MVGTGGTCLAPLAVRRRQADCLSSDNLTQSDITLSAHMEATDENIVAKDGQVTVIQHHFRIEQHKALKAVFFCHLPSVVY